jgi:hypothetical protein
LIDPYTSGALKPYHQAFLGKDLKRKETKENLPHENVTSRGGRVSPPVWSVRRFFFFFQTWHKGDLPMKALLRAGKIAVVLIGDDVAETPVSRIRITIWDWRMVLAWGLVVAAFALLLGPYILRALRL